MQEYPLTREHVLSGSGSLQGQDSGEINLATELVQKLGEYEKTWHRLRKQAGLGPIRKASVLEHQGTPDGKTCIDYHKQCSWWADKVRCCWEEALLTNSKHILTILSPQRLSYLGAVPLQDRLQHCFDLTVLQDSNGIDGDVSGRGSVRPTGVTWWAAMTRRRSRGSAASAVEPAAPHPPQVCTRGCMSPKESVTQKTSSSWIITSVPRHQHTTQSSRRPC